MANHSHPLTPPGKAALHHTPAEVAALCAGHGDAAAGLRAAQRLGPLLAPAELLAVVDAALASAHEGTVISADEARAGL